LPDTAGEHSSGAGQAEAEQQISRHVAGVREKDDFWTRLHCGKVINSSAGCCYITVDFATAASHNGIALFPGCSMIKDCKKSRVFDIFRIMLVSFEGKLFNTKYLL
jgi:hypothetical protein